MRGFEEDLLHLESGVHLALITRESVGSRVINGIWIAKTLKANDQVLVLDNGIMEKSPLVSMDVVGSLA